jgi:hypothetical protein
MIRKIIRVEGIVFFIIGLVVYLQLGGILWLFFLLVLLPDSSMIGYRKDAKTGAVVYNLVHNYAAGIIVFGLGLISGLDFIGYAGLIIFSHVGMDHAFGYGLKYPTAFKDTHLQRV